MRKSKYALICSFVAALVVGCSPSTFVPGSAGKVTSYQVGASEVDIERLYKDVSLADQINRNPVVVVPGMMGSQLRSLQQDRLVWGISPDVAGDEDELRQKEKMLSMALPLKRGASLLKLSDDIVSAGPMDRRITNFAEQGRSYDIYTHMMDIIESVGYRDVGRAKAGVTNSKGNYFTSFQFDYDWRRDIVESARALDQYLHFLKDTIEEEIQDRHSEFRDIKFNLVAYGMGGLVVRYYLRYGAQDISIDGTLPVLNWGGADIVENVVFLETPNAGTLQSLEWLLKGYQNTAPDVSYPPAVLGTMPAFYQMMPRYRHARIVDDGGRSVDLTNALIWKDYGWGLLSPEQDVYLQQLLPDVADREERYDIALEHLRKSLLRARHLHQALDIPAKAPDSLHMSMFLADGLNTVDQMLLEVSGNLKALKTAPGNGYITRASALMDERQSIYETSRDRQARFLSPIDWDQTIFVQDNPVSMMANATFVDNFLFSLMEAPQDQVYLITGRVSGETYDAADEVNEEPEEEVAPEPTLDQSIDAVLSENLLDWDMNKAVKNHRSRARKTREDAIKELWIDLYP